MPVVSANEVGLLRGTSCARAPLKQALIGKRVVIVDVPAWRPGAACGLWRRERQQVR